MARAHISVACKQALRGTPAAEREKEGELATTSLEIEYLAEMTFDVIILGACRVNVDLRGRFRSALTGGNLTGS